MQNRWSDTEASKYADNPLLLRVYSSRLLGKEPALVLHGGGNTSVKVTERNIFNETEEVIYVKGSGWDLSAIEPAGFSPVKLDVLRRMIMLKGMSDHEMVKAQRAALTDPYAPDPSIEAIVHAILPHTYVDHTHADAVVTISNTVNGEERLREIYGDRVLLVPYVKPGFTLAEKIHELIQGLDTPLLQGIILLHHGVFTFDGNAKQAYLKMIDIATEAERYLEKNVKKEIPGRGGGKEDLRRLAAIRKSVSAAMQKPVIALFDNDAPAASFSKMNNLERIISRGPLTPDHIIRTKRTPAVFSADPANETAKYARDYVDYFNRYATPGLTCLDPAPRWAVWKGYGTISFGQTLRDAIVVADIVAQTVHAISNSEALGGWEALPEKDLFDMEYWELEQAKLKKKPDPPQFAGKVILITGAASGIGKECVELFARQGGAVAALDMDPSFIGSFRRREVLEIVCDVTNKSRLKQAVSETIRKFGGLDIVVSNAGTFTTGGNIEAMADEDWSKSIAVNQTGHLFLLRECIPFLKEGIEPSIVIIGSKNVPAPGPGAGAYSSAKAGLTQLARVAALELGKDGIRVNVIHPNAVYDTAIWTDELLKERAAHYGVTTEEYKKANVLKTAITSNDVAIMVSAMAGKTFGKTTGAQVPVDGGNERII